MRVWAAMCLNHFHIFPLDCPEFQFTAFFQHLAKVIGDSPDAEDIVDHLMDSGHFFFWKPLLASIFGHVSLYRTLRAE